MTPHQLMGHDIRWRSFKISIRNIIRGLDCFGPERSQKVVQDWVHQCDDSLQNASPSHVAVGGIAS